MSIKDREVSMQQLTDWVEANKSKTWNFTAENYFDNTLQIKYLRFSLDTRDLKVFRIETEGAGPDLAVDFRDESEGTILDQLDKLLLEETKDRT